MRFEIPKYQAKSKLLLALQQAPDNALIISTFAYFFDQTGQTKLAKHYYKKALALAPQNGAIHNNYGVFLCRHRKYHAAIKEFLLAAKNISYLHNKAAYQNATKCRLGLGPT